MGVQHAGHQVVAQVGRQFGQLTAPVDALAVQPGGVPQVPQGGDDPGSDHTLAPVEGRPQRGAQVALVLVALHECLAQLTLALPDLEVLGEVGVVLAVAQRHLIRIGRFGETEPSVLAHALEQAVPGRAVVALLGSDHRLVDEIRQHLDHVEVVERLEADHVAGGLQAEIAHEPTQATEPEPLLLVEQVVAPVDGGLQGLMPVACRPGVVHQQAEPLVEPLHDLGRRHHAQPRHGELDRQRYAVEAPAEIDDVADVRRVDGEPGVDQAGPLDEQPNRVVPHRSRRIGGARRHPQRRNHVDRLAPDPQRLAAGGQHLHLRTTSEDSPHQHRDRVEQVLAVVEHQQRPPGADRGDDAVDQLGPRRRLHTQHLGDLVGDHVGVGDGGQLDQIGAVGKRLEQLAGGVQREAGLAGTARSGQRDQPVGRQHGPYLGLLGVPAHEARQLPRQLASRPREGSQRPNLVVEQRMPDLEDALGLGEVFEAVLSEVDQFDLGRKLAGQQLGGGARHEKLSTVAGRHHPGAAVHDHPEVVTVAKARCARVDSHANLQDEIAGRFEQADLRGEGGLEGVERRPERNCEAVAGGGEHVPTVALEGRPQPSVVLGQRDLHAIGFAVPQLGGTLDVGEQEGDLTRGQFHHVDSPFVKVGS